MLHSSIDYENYADYKINQYRKEAEEFRLLKQALKKETRSYPTPYDELLSRLGNFMINTGRELQRRAAASLRSDEFARSLH